MLYDMQQRESDGFPGRAPAETPNSSPAGIRRLQPDTHERFILVRISRSSVAFGTRCQKQGDEHSGTHIFSRTGSQLSSNVLIADGLPVPDEGIKTSYRSHPPALHTLSFLKTVVHTFSTFLKRLECAMKIVCRPA